MKSMDEFQKISIEGTEGKPAAREETEAKQSGTNQRTVPVSKEVGKLHPGEIGKTHRRERLLKFLKWLGIAVGVTVLAVLVMSLMVYLSARPLLAAVKETMAVAQEAYTAAKNQDLLAAEEKLNLTHEKLGKTQQLYQKLSWTRFIPGLNLYYKDGEHGLKAAMAGLEASQTLIAAVMPHADVLGFKGQGSFMGGTAEDRIVKMVQTLEKITPEIDKVADKVNTAETAISQIDPKRYPESFRGIGIRNRIIQAQNTVKEVQLAVTDAKPLIKVLPQALGYPVGKRYLVIFQNDGEIRPTGGFMTAFAVLHLESGKVRPEKSDDIYGLDRKFGRRLPAPEPIKKYLPLVNVWHLRDMNLSPDFKVSMATFKENYDKLPGEYDVDGIVVLDTEVLKRIVEIIGPIEVAGYGKFTLDEDPRCNIPQIICELEFIVDKPLATEATGRKSAILGPMMQEILTRSMSSGKNQWGNLFTTGINLMQEKHILMYFVNEDLQKAVESFGIAGRIKSYEGDYFHVNDTNFGGAKSNLYVTQEVKQEINTGADGTISKKVTITYTHPEPADDCNLESGGLCLSGILRNWFRVYVPKGARLVEGLGSEVEIETNEDLDKTVFEGFFTLRPESRTKIILTYELPNQYQQDQAYKMLIQKQPGTKAWKYTISFNGEVKEFSLLKDTEVIFPAK